MLPITKRVGRHSDAKALSFLLKAPLIRHQNKRPLIGSHINGIIN